MSRASPATIGPGEREAFYPDQTCTADDLLVPSEARQRAGYVRMITSTAGSVRLELVVRGAVDMVIYVDRPDLDAAALAEHRAQYGDTNFSVRRFDRSDEGALRSTVAFDASGTVIGSESEKLDDDGRTILITRRDRRGAVIGTIDQAWSADGDLISATERAADGTVISVFDPDG